MKKFLNCRNVAITIVLAFAFVALQLIMGIHAASAKAVTVEYLGRGIFLESQMSIEYDFYGEGQDRWTVQIPDFDEKFRMHTATFRWNEDRHVPPKAGTDRHDVWVGTCTLSAKSPWRYVDVFGMLGPIECSVYGDWSVKSKR